MAHEENQTFQRVYPEKIWWINEETQERGRGRRKITRDTVILFLIF